MNPGDTVRIIIQPEGCAAEIVGHGAVVEELVDDDHIYIHTLGRIRGSGTVPRMNVVSDDSPELLELAEMHRAERDRNLAAHLTWQRNIEVAVERTATLTGLTPEKVSEVLRVYASVNPRLG